MDTKVNYVIVGLFVIGLSFAAIFASIWIAGGLKGKHYKYYLTFVNEPVSGLSEKAAVKFSGVDVGYVNKIELNPKNPQEVRLELKIFSNTPVNQSTVATIRSSGLTGLSYLELLAKKMTAPPLVKTRHERYPVIPYTPSLFKQLDTVATDVSANISKVTAALSELLGEDNQKLLREILSNISHLTEVIQKNNDHIDSIILSSDKLLKNTAKSSEKFDQSLSEFNTTMKSAREATQNFTIMSKEAKNTFSSSNKTVKDLSEQLLPRTYEAIEKLQRVMANIETLTGELNKNPSMLVRGKRANAPGPGE